MRKIFKAQSGSVRISESTARRVRGTFQLTGTLHYDCTLVPAGPATLVTCRPAQEEMRVEITGSFDADPLGDSPGSVQYSG